MTVYCCQGCLHTVSAASPPAECPACRRRLMRPAAGGPTPRPLPGRATPVPDPPPAIGDTQPYRDPRPSGHLSRTHLAIQTYLDPPQEPGDLGSLGPLRVQKLIGAGGMGIVFVAVDPHLRRQVAVKLMRPEDAADPQSRQRFVREARAVAALDHEHVISIYHVGEANGLPYLTMPYLRGETLQARLKREGRLGPVEAARLGRDAAEGLAAAHAKGVIHRDIKPANLWLEGKPGSPGFRLKILDFGLARKVTDVHITQVGTLLGTPAYMAPEQATGQPVEDRCDLFSLGVVLYHALTGGLPFPGDTPGAILAKMVTEVPPAPAAVCPDVPVGLSELVMRLLARDPDGRPGSAREVAQEFARLRWELSPVPAVSGALPALPPRRALGWAAALAAAVAGAGAAGVVLWPAVRPAAHRAGAADPPADDGDPDRPIPPEEACRRLGQTRTVRMAFKGRSRDPAGDIVFTSRAEPDRDTFTVVITRPAREELAKLGTADPYEHFFNAPMQVSGPVLDLGNRGRPGIEVRSASQLVWADD